VTQWVLAAIVVGVVLRAERQMERSTRSEAAGTGSASSGPK
jgi:hypothetical protein